jgi:uncharacterized repeat protein (TIGR02543 family)
LTATNTLIPTQSAHADAQSDYYAKIASRWNTNNPVKVNFCGYLWDIVGINDNGSTNKVGIGTAGDTANDGSGLTAGKVTLLLDKSNTIVGTNSFNPNEGGNAYNGSNLQTVMNQTIYYEVLSCSEKPDIAPRTLAGESSNSGEAGYNSDHIAGTAAENQKIWPLSVREAQQFSSNTQRLFPNPPNRWWLRTPGWASQSAALGGDNGSVDLMGDVVNSGYPAVRPALYLNLTSAVFTGYPDISDVPYVDENGATQTAVNAKNIMSSNTTLTAGWYYVEGNVTTTNLAVSGDVKIILKDGAQLTANGETSAAGINVSSSNSLSIYGQSGQTGKIIATGEQQTAGIGGNNSQAGGTISISGGTITVTGGQGAAGIGGGMGGNGGNIKITNGTITALGGERCAGIGGGHGQTGGTISISGGTITATGGTDGGAGIGGGYAAAGTINISGGNIIANGGTFAAGIGGGTYGNGGTISISGGTISAVGGPGSYGGAGIGAGYQETGGTIFISGNTTTVKVRAGRDNFDIGGTVLGTSTISVKDGAKVWMENRGANAASSTFQMTTIYGTGADGYTNPYASTSTGIDIWGVYGATTNSNLNSTGTILGSLNFGASANSRTITLVNNGLTTLTNISVSFPRFSDAYPAESANAFELVSPSSGFSIPPLGEMSITIKPKENLPALEDSEGYTYDNAATFSWNNQVNYATNIPTEQNHSTGAIFTVMAVTNINVIPNDRTITYLDTDQLEERVYPTQASIQTVNWSSSNTDVATVDSTGLVTAVAVGDATITAKSTGYVNKYGTSAIHVTPKPETAPTLAIDWANETVTGFNTAATGFKIAETEAGLTTCSALTAAAYDISSIIASSSKTLWTKKCGTDTNHSESTTTSIEIPARPVAPGVTMPNVASPSTNVVVSGYNNSTMEFKCGTTSPTTWSSAAFPTVTAATFGNDTCVFRLKAVTSGSTAFHSAETAALGVSTDTNIIYVGTPALNSASSPVNTGYSISWTAATNTYGNTLRYTVKYSTTAPEDWTTGGTVVTNCEDITTNSCNVTGLTNGTTYYINVIVKDATTGNATTQTYTAVQHTVYSVSFNGNNATTGGTVATRYLLDSAVVGSAPTAPTKNDYDFLAWYNGSSAFTSWTAATTSNLSLTAHWQEKTPIVGTSNIRIDYQNEKLVGLVSGGTYALGAGTCGTNGANGTVATGGETPYLSTWLVAGTLNIVKCATVDATYHDSTAVNTLATSAHPTAPAISSNSGTISGLTSNMEYNTTGVAYAGTWTAIAGTTLSGVAEGTYYIRDKAVNGTGGHFVSEVAIAIVTIPVTGVVVAPTITTITYGQTAQLTKTVNPSDTPVQTVNWSSSNTDVATVNASGLVTSVSAGDATITAKSTVDQTKYGTTAVTVSKKPLTVSIGSVEVAERPYIESDVSAPVTGVVTIDSGIVNGDAITVSSCSGNYANDVVGTAKPVSLTCTLSGTKASSYTINTYPTINGEILDYTEVDLGDHELEVPPGSTVTPESTPGAGDSYVTLPTDDPEYEIIVDDVEVIVPGGSKIKEDGTVVVPPTSPQSVSFPPTPTVDVPGNSVLDPTNSTIKVPAGDVTIDGVTTNVPADSVVSPADGTITVPAGSVTVNGETVVVPAGSVINTATGDITLPTGKVAVTQTKGSENLSLSSATITQGKIVTITGSGFTPNELVRLELHAPTKVLSASVTVNASGKFTLTKTVTTATAAGNYQVVAYDKTSGIQLKSANLKVVKPAPPKPVSAKVKKAKGAITFIWGSSGLLTTVEIYYRVKGTSKWKIVRVSSSDRKKIKLKRKKTYQFQLRSCKTVNGKNYYSTWTKKTVKL